MTLLADFALFDIPAPDDDHACRYCGSAIVKKPGPGRYSHYCTQGCRSAANPPRRVSDPDSLRSRRKRLHATGDHSLCLHDAEQGEKKPQRSPEERSRHEAGDHSLCDPEGPRHGTCSECGKTVQVTATSAPPDRRRCRDCQRAHPRRSTVRGSCATCGNPLTWPGRIYCSVRCANGRAGTRAGSRTARPCEICGTQFKPSGGAYRPGKVQRTCGRACGVELRRREYGWAGNGPRTHWPFTRVYIRPCEHCGELFVGRTKISRHCSQRCQRTADNYRRFGVPQCRCACGTQIPARRKKCNACLAADKKLRRQRKKRAERARKRGVRREPYTLAEIAARDRYRCGICIAEGRSRQARVDMTKAVPHLKAPTVDHVLPLAEGGDDTRANVQLAHFGCNARKHTGGSQQLALIG